MAKAVIARIEGDDYQARYFWFQVCRLFQPHTNVVRVSYEWDKIKGFDDVVSTYEPPINNDRGGLASEDYFQIKFHVSQQGVISWKALMDPAFIGSSSTSFLQRLNAGYLQAMEQGRQCRFILVTPWNVDINDPLVRLVSNNAGEIRLDRLFDGTGSRSAMGLIRTGWAKHLRTNESGLANVLASLRIYAGWGGLAELNDRLNDKLQIAGFKPVSDASNFSAYDDLIRKLIRAGKMTFTATEIKEICEREGLWVGTSIVDSNHSEIGIRSFIRRTEYMEDETEYMLDLVPYFNDRTITDNSLWKGRVIPEVAAFLGKYVTSGKNVNLHLDTHSSVALTAGYYLDSKAGVSVTPIQKTLAGKAVWKPQVCSPVSSYPLWSIAEKCINSDEQDLVIGISITHDVSADVENYLSLQRLNVRELVNFIIQPCPCSTAIIDGTHALKLVQELVAVIRKHRIPGNRTLHLFIAGPNGFSFLLGQHCHGLGKLITYEYDFDSGAIGKYEPAIELQ